MPSVYFLHSEKDTQWYIGCTSKDARDRFAAHCQGRVLSTKHRRPLRIAYVEDFETLSAARKREWYLKHPSGYQEKRRIIEFLLDNFSVWPLQGPINRI
jgi:putative endonuclease